MEMHQIRYFLAVADLLNFTRAAEKCNVAQPSLTRAIKMLEEELGGELFHRERANTHLSELGCMLLPHLQQVFDEAQAASNAAKNFGKLAMTPMKLGVMCTIAPSQFIGLLGALRQRHPGINIEIVDSSARMLSDALLAGDLDVAIYCPPPEPTVVRLNHVPLFVEHMAIVVAPTHRFASQQQVCVKDLNGENYLNRINCEFNGVAKPFFEAQGVSCPTVFRSERDDWLLEMIAAGAGFGFMPESLAKHPSVVARRLVDPGFSRQVNLTTVRGRPHSPAIGALVREAIKHAWPGQSPPVTLNDEAPPPKTGTVASKVVYLGREQRVS
jgi:LysR family hydrogen peroxide-inducible transcriptional activator